MNVLVNGELKKLECKINGVDCSQDLHGNATNNSVWNDEADCWEMKEDDFDFWKSYLKTKEKYFEIFGKELEANDIECELEGMQIALEEIE